MMPQAQADWVKDVTEFTPDSKIVIHEDAFGASHPATDPSPIISQEGIARGDAYTIRGSAGTSKLNGSAKTWFRWQTDPRSSNSQVPEKLSLLITASANATARDRSTQVATTSSGTSTSTDPRSQPTQYYPHTPGNEKATASIGDESSSGVAGSESTSAGVSIRKLVQVSTNGDLRVASPSYGFAANAELSGGRVDVSPGPSSVPVDGTVHTAATFNAEIDSRSVTLSRGGRYEHSELKDGE